MYGASQLDIDAGLGSQRGMRGSMRPVQNGFMISCEKPLMCVLDV